MKNLNINSFNSVIKYKLMRKKYPEIDEIFKVDGFSLSFSDARSSYKYIKECNRQYEKYCKEVEDIYQELLCELGVLVSDIKFNPSIFEIMYIFSYIYYNGYLSIDNKFEFCYPDKELAFKRAFSVFDGKAACRNVGSLFSDLLNIFNVYSFGIVTDRETYKSEKYKLPKEYAELIKPSQEMINIQLSYGNNISHSIGNHYEILTYYNDWFLLDPSAICSYDITTKKSNYEVLKYLRFWSIYAMGEYNIKDTVKFYNLFKEKYIKVNEHIETQKECFALCEKNSQKIKQFHNDNLLSIETLGNIF